MKKLPFSFLVLMLCLFAGELQAQIGYGNPYNRFGRRSTGIPQAASTPQEPEPLTAEELIDQQMPQIKENLELDPFEEAVVRSILVKYVQKRMELQILKLEPNKMKEEYKKIQKQQDEEMKAGLPPEKFETYKKILENPSKAKREKKKKKRKKS